MFTGQETEPCGKYRTVVRNKQKQKNKYEFDQNQYWLFKTITL